MTKIESAETLKLRSDGIDIRQKNMRFAYLETGLGSII